MADKMDELKLIHMSEVEATVISWLWYPYIPFGKITQDMSDFRKQARKYGLQYTVVNKRRDSAEIMIRESGVAQLNMVSRQLPSLSVTHVAHDAELAREYATQAVSEQARGTQVEVIEVPRGR